MSEDREHCIAAGMDAHLAKPVEPSRNLVREIDGLVDQVRERLHAVNEQLAKVS